MKRPLTKTINGTRTAAASAAVASTSILWRRMRRMRPSYSAGGICWVFHERPHVSHVQRWPYATRFVSPHSQVIVIGGRAIPGRLYGWAAARTRRDALNLVLRGVRFARARTLGAEPGREGGRHG